MLLTHPMQRRFLRRAGWIVASAAGVFSLGGCATAGSGGDDIGMSTAAAASTAPDIFAKLGIAPPSSTFADGGATPQPFAYDEVQAPYSDAAGCKAFSSQTAQATRDCLCDNCFALEQQCDALDHCIEIVDCGNRIGCTDAYSCYLTPAKSAADPTGAGCVTEIDSAGNGSVSAALSLQIQQCRATSKCP